MKKTVYEPNAAVSRKSYVKSFQQYKDLYQKSIDDPARFWSEIASQFHWEVPYDVNKFHSYNFDLNKGPISIKWMEGAKTNVCYNLLDRNIKNGMGDKIAYFW
ncbi:acetyl-coenzyme A synthetase-like [Macrosteles quadrilineatus]|uniref:acetyl-coenzyme A synthetase-like n=1 Tax=Macrosteles quadrilineatus TaxID=74068 RepID=UPI0023E0ED4B|nr:acetyl-coenzyme A synthetase-like [Macrosteles quadrilineatus]